MRTLVREGFGVLLRRYREAAALSQEELAEQARLSVEAISALERGVRRTPYWATVRLLADALGLQGAQRATFEAAARGKRPGSAAIDIHSDPGHALPPFVGRGHEVALLEHYLTGDAPPVLFVAGEPGIGKTRLLQEVVEQAMCSGWTVLAGGCQRRGGENLYAPLLETLHGHLRGQETTHLRVALRGCAWLVRLLPELASSPIEPLPPWTLPPEQERRLMFGAVAQYLANVAGPAGTLLLLDDLQWAGQDALDLLTALVRSHPASPVRVVGAYRDTEVRPQDPLAVLLGELARAGLAEQHTLGPLGAEEMRQLLDSVLEVVAVPAHVRERLAQRTGGVPFFVLSCAQALRLHSGDEGAGEAVPWDVAQSVRQRVAALSATTGQMLGAAAVIGRLVPPVLLRAVAGLPEQEVLLALDAACQARLLVEAERAYRFAHDVIREVIETDLGVARRMAVHRRIAETLEKGPGELAVDVLAYHYARSDAAEKAALYLEQAGDRARARYAHAAAVGYYRELAERLDTLRRDRDAARAREKLGGVLTTLARYAAALPVLKQAADTYRRTGDLEGWARVAAQIGEVHTIAGRRKTGCTTSKPCWASLVAAWTPRTA
jgi:transcriptional regulator with XRE-family HTH domain